ncbi:flippase [Corallococcus exercitus]|uniref:Flippase n=1 Tax=Corallococcus exercitus TaxID=2316736 RepID=A0A7Y4KS00_9BACT|nr:flippase [Corallococcus exercitus]
MNSPISPSAEADDGARANEVRGAVRSTLQLGGSLMVTYAIALGIRALMPRYLGPEAFGYFNWSEAFAATFFVATNLGLETYIRKEVPVRPDHASDFFGTTMLLRLGMTLILMVALALVLHTTGEPPEVQHLVQWFAVAQSLIVVNASMAALLHSKGKVAGLSVSNVITKIVWGGGLALMAAFGVGLQWLAVPMVLSEAVKLVISWKLAKEHLDLKFRIDIAATKKVMKACLPFFLTAAALACNGRTDMSLLGKLASKEEVGWYGGAFSIAGLTFLISPIFGWVLMPMMSRAAARSPQELSHLTRRSLEGVLAFTVPVMMAMVLGADLWVRLMCGPGFEPAALPLRVLSPIFVMAYVTMVSSIWLTMSNKEWWVTLAATMGAVVNPLFNLALIPWLYGRIGPSGGATATALSMFLTEVIVTVLFLGRMGRNSFDRRSLLMVAKTAVVCGVCVALDRVLSGAGVAPWPRLGLTAATYVVGVLGTGAVRPAELLQVVRMARQRGGNGASSEVAVSAAPTA